jgi:hypothetical protein
LARLPHLDAVAELEARETRMTADPTRIISRAEARALGLKRYFTGEPCKHGHVAERWVSGRVCVECARGWRAANLEKERERDRLKRAANPQKRRDYMRRWRAANKDKINEQRATRRKAARASD